MTESQEDSRQRIPDPDAELAAPEAEAAPAAATGSSFEEILPLILSMGQGQGGGGGLLAEEISIPEWIRTGSEFGGGYTTDQSGGQTFEHLFNQTLGEYQLTLYPDYGYGSSAIFGTALPGTMSYRQAMSALYSLPARDLMTIQDRLWRAGYYGEEAITNGMTPRLGVAEADTQAAWQAFLSDVVAYSESGVTGDELLADRIRRYAGFHEAANAGRTVGTEIVRLTDPAAIEVAARNVAEQKLGRSLSPDEAAAIVQVVSSEEMAAEMHAARIAQADRFAMAGRDASGRRLDARGAMPQIMMGGGPDSPANRFAQELASLFGLSIVRGARDDTLTFGFSGSEENMTRFEEWVKAHQSGDNEAAAGPPNPNQAGGGASIVAGWKWVGLEDEDAEADHIEVSFRDGAGIPEFASLTQPVNANRQLDSFLHAMRLDDSSPQQYMISPSRGIYGAYGLSKSQMEAALSDAGLDPNDKSPQAQDAAARQYASDLYEEFGDWRLVAIAFRSSRGLARRYKAHGIPVDAEGNVRFGAVTNADGREFTPVPSPGMLSATRVLSRYLRHVGKKMAEYTPAEALEPLRLDDIAGSFAQAGVAGGGIATVTSVNPIARAELEVEKRHGNEAGAHSAAEAWDAMVGLIDRGVASGANTDNPGALQ